RIAGQSGDWPLLAWSRYGRGGCGIRWEECGAVDKVVAQVPNLLCRRASSLRTSRIPTRLLTLDTPPIRNRRYSRLGNLRYVLDARRCGAPGDFVNHPGGMHLPKFVMDISPGFRLNSF